MASARAFRGPRRKIVLAFDIGTTYSGISYTILDPGVVPEINGVTRFPAHEHVTGASKIPTVIYYDRAGKVKAVGAEAMKEGIYEQAEDEEWVKAEWFKLHLRSKIAPGAGKEVNNIIPPLPPGKTVVDVFADFLAYLYECAAAYIQDTHANGATLWDSVEGQIEFVLSHPNGWEGTQQSEMRKAAIQAGLVPDTPNGHARLSFVTEGEASLHYAIQNGLPEAATNAGEGVVIVDAGGGTIDVSSYRSVSTDIFEEIAVAQCHFNGSVFVTFAAQEFLVKYLEDSVHLDDLDHIVRCFDKTTKLRFRSPKEAQYIKFGSARDNDPLCNIRYGQLKLEGSDMVLFFKKSIQCIIQAVMSQRDTALKSISHVILVGGFSASDWVYSEVRKALKPLGLDITRPDNHVNKAVSDGAMSFYLDHFVRRRVAKVTYGAFCRTVYDSSDLEHVAREHNTYVSTTGTKLIRDVFDVILPKNTQVSETKEFRRSYYRGYKSEDEYKADKISIGVWCYRGNEPNPRWKDVNTSGYTLLCNIQFHPSHLALTPMSKPGVTAVYYRLDYDIVLHFGLTELKAQFAWKEDGHEKYSPATILYEPDTNDF